MGRSALERPARAVRPRRHARRVGGRPPLAPSTAETPRRFRVALMPATIPGCARRPGHPVDRLCDRRRDPVAGHRDRDLAPRGRGARRAPIRAADRSARGAADLRAAAGHRLSRRVLARVGTDAGEVGHGHPGGGARRRARRHRALPAAALRVPRLHRAALPWLRLDPGPAAARMARSPRRNRGRLRRASNRSRSDPRYSRGSWSEICSTPHPIRSSDGSWTDATRCWGASARAVRGSSTGGGRSISSRFVAIKVLHEETAASPEWRRRFEREARALSVLAHPNVVPVTDSGIDRGVPFLVMELLAGQDAGGSDQGRTAAAPAGAGHRPPDAARARVRSRQRNRPPRSETGQRVPPGAAGPGRSREAPGLRNGEVSRGVELANHDRADARRGRDRNAGVHVPRTGEGRAGGCPDRCLCGRRPAVRASRRAASVRCRLLRGLHRGAPHAAGSIAGEGAARGRAVRRCFRR